MDWALSGPSLLLLALLASFASAASTPPPLGAGADIEAVRALEQAMERAPQRIRALEEAPLEIRSIESLDEGERGGTARVLVVETDRGRKLAKVSFVRTVSSRMVPWILQDEASRAGIAPALHKIVEGDQLVALRRAHPVLRDLVSPWAHAPDSPPISMVVMDLVEHGFSFMQRGRSHRSLEAYPAAALQAWTVRLEEIERYLNRHNVQMADEQFLIQPDGGVMAIDFDHYTFVDTRSRRWAYVGVTDYPDVDYWKTPSPTTPLNDLRPNIRVLHELFTARPGP